MRWRPVGLALMALLGAAALLYWARRPAPSLLLVTFDTLRADHVGAYGNAEARTPALDGLARRGLLFRSASSPVPLTGPSHATILTGLYPPVHGVRDNVRFPLEARHPGLATLLRRAGYRTAAFVGAYPVAAAFGFGAGFDQFDESFRESPVPGVGAERPANEVADAAIRWLKALPGGRPFFMWVHLYDPHAPYTPPSPLREEFAANPYAGEIAFADAQLTRLLDVLREHGHLDDTVVLATADHGESLGEHGEKTHTVLIYESTLHVPLILAGPGVPVGREVSERVGLVDIVPTVLALLGQDVPSGLPGHDLRSTFRGRPLPARGLYAESLFGRLNCRWSSLRGWTEGPWKLVEGSETELFDLAQDPKEMRNLAEGDPDRVERMRKDLRAALAAMAPGGDAARPHRMSLEQEERLRSLGYAALGAGGGGRDDQRALPDPRRLVHVYERIQVAMSAPRGLGVASAEIEELVALDPQNPFAHFAAGSLAYRAGRLREADEALARALELDPERPTVRLQRGRVLRDRGRLEQSETELRMVVDQLPDDAAAAVALAETLIARGNQKEADPLLDAVLKRDPEHAEALAAKGRLLMADGRPQEAVPFFEKAAARETADALVALAFSRLRAGDLSSSREAAARALARAPNHPWALTALGAGLLREGRREEGLRVLRQARAASPRRLEAWHDLAAAFEAAGEATAAEECRRAAGRLTDE